MPPSGEEEAIMTQQQAAADYPVKLHVERATGERNKTTIGFRWILAIPHLILVGGPGFVGAGFIFGIANSNNWSGFGGNGVLGAVAGVCAFISCSPSSLPASTPRGCSTSATSTCAGA